MVFRGGPVLTLDGKGRITVPVRWRDMLVATVQGQLVVAKNPDGCLSLYPLPVGEHIYTCVCVKERESVCVSDKEVS